MKNYLLTWFGMSDYRAAEGEADKSGHIPDGPIFAALKEHDYTDALILCPIIENDGEQNTVEGHDFFLASLKERMGKFLEEEGKKREVIIEKIPCALKHINDYESMKNWVTKALEQYENDTASEKHLSVYISPGTTLMAYTWSEALRQHPYIDAKILVSPRDKAETHIVDIRGTALKGNGDETFIDEYEYDAIFHLFSENNIPILLTLKQFSQCKKHIFLTDKKMSAQSMEYVVKKYSKAFETIDSIKPNKPRSVFNTVSRHLKNNNYTGNLGFNVTGGTKPMTVGALDACRAFGIVPFYYGKELVNLSNDETKPAVEFDTVDEIVKFNIDKTLTSDKTSSIPDELIDIANKIQKNSDLVEKCYGQINRDMDDHRPTDIKNKGIKIRCTWDKPDAYLELNGKVIFEGEFEEFPHFLSGGWLEVYVYSQLIPLKDAGLIKDLRLNYTVKYDKNKDYNEADVLFTDGKKLYFVECKAGEVKSDVVEKIKTVAAAFGGVKAVPIIVAATKWDDKIDEVTHQKIQDQVIKLLKLKDIQNLTEAFKDIIEGRA